VRIGIFGGSFDPPHQGHVLPLEHAAKELELEGILILPTARPPHKPDREFAPALQRFTMVELAFLDQPKFQVSSFELTLDRPAYTIETLEHFRAELPDVELWLLVGADSFAELHTWRRGPELAQLAHIGVLARPGWDRARIAAVADPEMRTWLADGRAVWLDSPLVPTSSTAVRTVLARGDEPPAGMVSPRVLDYIRKYNLYR
jgi:nicotinate-nucleotide adenylyltransferase